MLSFLNYWLYVYTSISFNIDLVTILSIKKEKKRKKKETYDESSSYFENFKRGDTYLLARMFMFDTQRRERMADTFESDGPGVIIHEVCCTLL